MMDKWLRQSLNGSHRGRVRQGVSNKCGGMQNMRQNSLLKMESDGKHLWWTNVPSAIKRIEDLA